MSLPPIQPASIDAGIPSLSASATIVICTVDVVVLGVGVVPSEAVSSTVYVPGVQPVVPGEKSVVMPSPC